MAALRFILLDTICEYRLPECMKPGFTCSAYSVRRFRFTRAIWNFRPSSPMIYLSARSSSLPAEDQIREYFHSAAGGDSRFPFFLSFHKKNPVCSLTAYLIRRNTKTEMSLLFNQMSSATVRVSLSSSKYVDHIFLPPTSH